MITPLGSLLGSGIFLGSAFSAGDPLYSILPKMAVFLGIMSLLSFIITRLLKRY